MNKYQAALAIKNAIESTEQHSVYVSHGKSIVNFWDGKYQTWRIKRVYRNAGTV